MQSTLPWVSLGDVVMLYTSSYAHPGNPLCAGSFTFCRRMVLSHPAPTGMNETMKSLFLNFEMDFRHVFMQWIIAVDTILGGAGLPAIWAWV